MPDLIDLENQQEQHEPIQSTSDYFEIIRKNNFDIKWLQDTDLQERQAQILKELPSLNDLAQFLVSEIKKDYLDNELHAKLKGEEVDHPEVGQHTRSLLFERLVQIEKNLYFSKEEPIPTTVETIRWADQDKEMAITEIIRHPPFKQLIRTRRPDLMGIQARERDNIGPVEEGVLVITSTYEVKSGKHLDYRAYRQMKGGELKSVEQNLEEFAKAVNNLSPEEATKMGLEGMGKKGRKLMLVKKVRQHIVMTRDINIDDLDKLINRRGPSDSKGKGDTFAHYELEEFTKMLRGNHETIKVILQKSSISGQELDKLRDQVLPLVKSIIEKN